MRIELWEVEVMLILSLRRRMLLKVVGCQEFVVYWVEVVKVDRMRVEK